MEISLWRETLLPYKLAVDELVTKFNHLKSSAEEMGMYSPIYSISGRVKSITSILEKVMKKHIPLDQMEESIFDIAGVRIICQFHDDIMQVVEMIRNRKDMEIVEELDYINNPKPSGYRSYHLKLRYEVQLFDGPKSLFAEIQIRTMGMNCWSTIEHSLQYKYKDNMPDEIKDSISESAIRMLDAEKELSRVRDDVMLAQADKAKKRTLISDIIITILNIYQNCSRREAIRIQDEFLEIYKLDDYDKLKHFAAELDVVAEGFGVQEYNSDIK